ncbi:MAG TPA: cysteine desulfurase family protein [Bacilli bacterium]|nr:cysteine desulfurase family protein [Bacilli bacterium]
MVYLDYSATTPVNKEVLDTFDKVSLNYIGNPNSLHRLGVESKNLIEDATKQIKDILKTDKEVIYTSGSSESNNLVIKGVCSKYKNRGNHIITSPFEHSSIYGPLNYLMDNGYDVDFVNVDENGLVDLNHLKSLMRDTTILVTIASVNSEIGLLQPIKEIGDIVKEYPKCYFHSDMTQSIGKVQVDIDNVDFVSFSAHKFYGIKGMGCLLKNENIVIDPLIHGGKSTTNYRSGTPAVALIASMSKALRLIYENFDDKYKHVLELNNYIKDKLKQYSNVYINSNNKSIPHILNISILGVKPETMLHALESYDIFISTQSACSSSNTLSKAVLSLTNDQKRAESSIRISLSYLTTQEEVNYFLECFDKCYNELVK